MSGLTVKVEDHPLRDLLDAMGEYETILGKDGSQALAKGGREATFALHQEFRRQPPRPIEGTITREARARGFSLNVLSRSYLAGYTSALRTMGGNKSGYFRITDVNGREVATPIVLGRRRRIVRAGRKNVFQRGSLLTSKAELLDASTLPPDAKRLNVTALAANRAVGIRERAALGGFLAAQFLTYRKVRVGTGSARHTVLTKNKVLAGEVIMETDNDDKLEKVTIVGRLAGTARIAQRFGIVPKALARAARNFRADMAPKIKERWDRLLRKAG